MAIEGSDVRRDARWPWSRRSATARWITPALEALVDWQIAQGTPMISPVGTTGESPTLSHDEHERVIAAVVERAAGRAKVCPARARTRRPRRSA